MPGELNKLPFLSALGSIVLVIASLYWAQAVLIPVALAILLTFLLNPVVTVLQSNGLGRAPAAVLVVVLVSVIVVAAGWVTASQALGLQGERGRDPGSAARGWHRLRGDEPAGNP